MEMSFSELWFRRVVIWAARTVPVESPVWATFGIFAPNFVSFILVRGTIREAAENPIIGALLKSSTLFWMEVGIQVLMAMVGLSFLCRLLQICDVKYFDKYKVEESK
jgi:hypothetical protein